MLSNVRAQTGAAPAVAEAVAGGTRDVEISEPAAVRRLGVGPSSETGRSAEPLHVLHEIFEAQADTRPDAIAVVFGREETTYAELAVPELPQLPSGKLD